MHDDQSDSVSTEYDDNTSSAVATVDAITDVSEAAPDWNGPRCEKCDAPIKSDVVAICRKCGWYSSLGTFVEVDPNWETIVDPDQPAPSAPQKSHVRVWIDLLPRWSWVIIASVLAVVVESVVVRFATPAGSSIRTIWSLGQLAAGVLIFAGCHIFNFLVLAADDAEVGAIDLLLKPLKLWMRAFHILPTRLWVTNTAVSSVAAAVMSPLVIGGIPYERLWDWGFEPPAKQELMGAVMDRVKELDSRNGADSLEEAVADFAGDKGIDEQADPPKPRLKTDCVILGYQLDKDGRLTDLVLGTNHLAKLVYAGRVTPNMSDEERVTLLKLLHSIRTRQPLITIESDTTTWVKPKYACRVSYGQREKGRLSDIQWERLLGRIGPQ